MLDEIQETGTREKLVIIIRAIRTDRFTYDGRKVIGDIIIAERAIASEALVAQNSELCG